MSTVGHDGTVEMLRHVLAEVRFPARRWEVLTAADLYGVDPSTRGRLRDLPERCYEGLDQIVRELAAHEAAAGAASASRERRAASAPTTRRPAPDPRERRRPDLGRWGALSVSRSSQ